MKDSYDYKPLSIKIFNNKSEGIQDLLIDGTKFNTCISLAEENTKKLNGGYFEIRSRRDDKLIYSSAQ
jgi:hypothetical protein|tara:strand:- start:59 stop:262 length:204 start_codon:yes stop_codon:yes gene_type:complete